MPTMSIYGRRMFHRDKRLWAAFLDTWDYARPAHVDPEEGTALNAPPGGYGARITGGRDVPAELREAQPAANAAAVARKLPPGVEQRTADIRAAIRAARERNQRPL